jgi:hypothetical protein
MSIQPNLISNECIACGSFNIDSSPAFFMPFISHRAFNSPMSRISKEITGLRDILDGYAYQFCRSLYCRSCGHLASDIRFNDEQMRNLYRDYRGDDYLKLREFYEPGYIKRNSIFNHEYHYRDMVDSFILRYMEIYPKSALDWGGDTGINTPLKEQLKLHHIFDISNTEPVKGASLVNEDTIPNYLYDLVVCQHVLEHLPFPSQSIANLVKKINGDPFFYFEVPHEPIMRKTPTHQTPNKKHWHEHINFYTEDSLAKLLLRCGLTPISVISTDISKNSTMDSHVLQCVAKLSGAKAIM